MKIVPLVAAFSRNECPAGRVPGPPGSCVTGLLPGAPVLEVSIAERGSYCKYSLTYLPSVGLACNITKVEEPTIIGAPGLLIVTLSLISFTKQNEDRIYHHE